MTAYRICFAGTPGFAAGHLAALLQSRHTVIAAYTQPDRPTGRGKKLQPSPVKQLATAQQIPVLQPPSLRDASAQAELAALQADVLVVVAYGLILPQAVLDIPRVACLNVHASLLPRWRGAAPIERALLAGDAQTGITIMQMEAGLDTGPMLRRDEVAILETDTREGLEQKLLEAGKRSLIDVLDDLPGYLSKAEAQDDRFSTYAAKLEKEESRIDWSQPAASVQRLVRATVGRNPAYTTLDNDRLRIVNARISSTATETGSAETPGLITASDRNSFTVQCGQGLLEVLAVQLPGKKPLPVRDVMNARPTLFAQGRLLGTTS
ncbi:MAG: methionyl-tRNA formyltransferase [Pseudohongiellaceae bacterium]